MRLFALLRGTLRRGDVLVADRGFWSFANLAFLPLKGRKLTRVPVATWVGQQLGWRLHTLPTLHDIDEPADLRWLPDDLQPAI